MKNTTTRRRWERPFRQRRVLEHRHSVGEPVHVAPVLAGATTWRSQRSHKRRPRTIQTALAKLAQLGSAASSDAVVQPATRSDEQTSSATVTARGRSGPRSRGHPRRRDA